ncbi:MAG: DUF6600 domain-containing protein [Terriglobales bacterium]
MKILNELRRYAIALSLAALVSISLSQRLIAQNDSDSDRNDPPTRVARLAYLQGAVSFQPAGESDWVDAVPNRPITIGDQLWVDNNSRAELELGSALIDLGSNTGISFLNLDDNTIQIQLSSGVINVRVRRLGRDDDFEIDTPNQAFTIEDTGRYRVEASEDGTYTVVSVREGEGESTGNGSTYTVRAGQRVTFDGTDTLHAEMEEIGAPDDFDSWCYNRYSRYEHSMSARYVSNDVVGYADLDDSGDWRPALGYGDVWFPRVAAGWAPYREGHWAWIDPWGWTWVDDEPWGYAPFHYGRWAFLSGRWGWVPGPIEVRPVYAPALVVFVGGGGIGIGGNVGWFPLGPREVYVPSYRVSRRYLASINMSGTVVNQTVITNVYNTTIIRNETNIANVKYVNRGVSGAITAVPQRAFISAQPVARVAVSVNAKQWSSMPVSTRVAVAPTSNSVLGARFDTANRVKAPPAAVARRSIVARSTPPPAPVPFAARQQALAANPGQPIPRQQMRQMQMARPANAEVSRPQIRQAPVGRPATAAAKPGSQQQPNAPGNGLGNQPGMNRPENRPGNQPGTTQPAANQPAYRQNNPPGNERPQPVPQQNRPKSAPPERNQPDRSQPNRPEPNQPGMNRPDQNRPMPNNRPPQQPMRNERPSTAQPPAQNERPPAIQPRTAPKPAQPGTTQPPSRPEANVPPQQPQRNEPAARPEQPKQPPPADSNENRKQDKKQKDDQKKRDEKPPGD